MWLFLLVGLFYGWFAWFNSSMQGFAPEGRFIPTAGASVVARTPLPLVTSSAGGGLLYGTNTPAVVLVTSSVGNSLFLTAVATISNTNTVYPSSTPTVTPSMTITNTPTAIFTLTATAEIDRWANCYYPNLCQSCADDKTKFCPLPTVSLGMP